MTVFADTMRERVLTAEAMADVQRAADLLRSAAPAVKEALDLLAPIEWQFDDEVLALYEAGVKPLDQEVEAIRAGVYEEAVGLAFTIMDDAKRISYRR